MYVLCCLDLQCDEQVGQALNEGTWSVHAWQKALDSLPKENLSPGELKQKDQYEAGLKAASEPQVIKFSKGAGSMPWECARAIKPELIARRHEMVTSSVCSINVLFFTITNINMIPCGMTGLGHSRCL
jgi:stress-induced-phosphoprotein 1